MTDFKERTGTRAGASGEHEAQPRPGADRVQLPRFVLPTNDPRGDLTEVISRILSEWLDWTDPDADERLWLHSVSEVILSGLGYEEVYAAPLAALRLSDLPTVYVLQTGEPDAHIVEVWTTLDDAERRRGEMHSKYPGMGYYVEGYDMHGEPLG